MEAYRQHGYTRESVRETDSGKQTDRHTSGQTLQHYGVSGRHTDTHFTHGYTIREIQVDRVYNVSWKYTENKAGLRYRVSGRDTSISIISCM